MADFLKYSILRDFSRQFDFFIRILQSPYRQSRILCNLAFEKIYIDKSLIKNNMIFSLLSVTLSFLLLGFLLFLVGYNFSFIFFRDNQMFKKKKSYLEFILYNFGIGMGLYVFYAYCVILLLPFSIYTVHVPILIFNIACIFKFRRDGG